MSRGLRADRLLGGHYSSSQRRYSDPTLLSGSSALSDFYNTQSANTQIGTPKELHPKWVMGPSATDATNFASDRGSPGGNRDSNSTTKYTSSPNAPYQQAERQTHRDNDYGGYISFSTKSSTTASFPTAHRPPETAYRRPVKLDLFMEFLLG